MDRKLETKIVKESLVKAGYTDVGVTHGRGTAWGWLHVEVSADRPGNCSCRAEGLHRCVACGEVDNKVTRLIQDVTGRHGDYEGNTLVQVRFKTGVPA